MTITRQAPCPPSPSAPPLESAQTAPARRWWTALDALVALHGLAVVVLLAADDPVPWPHVRAAVAAALTGGVWRIARHASRWPQGMALIALGIPGVVVGAAIGLAHAVRVGVGVESISGLLALLTGAGLTGLGVRELTRGAWWRKAVAVPIGLGITYGVVLPVALATFVTNVPPLPPGEVTPADRGMAYEDVTLRTDDGVRLAAWYVPSTNGAAVVLLAGAGGVRSDVVDHAAVLARHGYGVMLLDVRGHGDSDGDAMLWGWHGATDLRAAVDHLAARPEVDRGRIGATGMSMGAEEAINALGTDPRVRAVVAEGASGQGPSDEGNRQVGGWAARWFGWVTTRAADLMTSAHQPPKMRDSIVDAAPRPVMIIVGAEAGVEVTSGRHFEAAAPDRVELWVVPGSGHTQGYATAPLEWEQRVTGFLDRALA